MAFQFSSIEFKGMMYNPSKVPEGTSVLKIYPQLGAFPIFKKSPGKGIDNNKVLLYIFCMYDFKTPYRLKHSDVTKRKLEVAHDVGFVVDKDGRFDSTIEDILKGKNQVVNAKIVEYVRLHRNSKYAYLVAIESSYFNLMQEIVAGETSKLKEARNVQQELENILSDIINEDDNPITKDTVLKYMEEERLGLRPEEIAMKLANGEEI